jgi:hypothetical protein
MKLVAKTPKQVADSGLLWQVGLFGPLKMAFWMILRGS